MKVQQSNIVYLSIGGFIIRVEFKRHADPEVVGINHLQKQVARFFHFFVVSSSKKRVDYSIKLIPQNVSYEQPNKRDAFMYFFKEEKNLLSSFAHISIGQFVFLVLYALQKLLVKHGGFFYHCSAIEKEGRAIIFTGRPGAGKSTAARLLSTKYRVLADDSMIVRKHRNQFYLYQVPPIEKVAKIVRSPRKYLIDSVLFLKKNSIGSIAPLLKSNNLFLRFLQEVWSQPKDIKVQKKMYVDFFNAFVKGKRFFRLSFPKKRGALCGLIDQHAQAEPMQ